MPKRRELHHFIRHLRLHYQLFILSGSYLLSGITVQAGHEREFLLQFLNVHVLLFGGVTAYNSYWDKDVGPIGGLRHPPPMTPWMLTASWLLQLLGLIFAANAGAIFLGIYALSLTLFWLYSSPLVRLKGKPLMSLVVIGIATGACAFLLGYIAGGSTHISMAMIGGMLGTSMLVTSLYPLSQIYQREEDHKRGDMTFAVRFGLAGVQTLFRICYPLGIILLSRFLASINFPLSLIFFVLGSSAGLLIIFFMRNLRQDVSDYRRVMTIKYAAGCSFSAFSLILFFFRLNHFF